MTHFKTFILSCLLALAAFPAIAERADFIVDGFGYAITSTTDLTVKVVEGPDQAVVTVPSTVVFNKRTFRVTEISNDAFYNHENLTSVDMPSITYISNGYEEHPQLFGAFSGCKNLYQVNMPSATFIGDYAFCDCDALTNVTLPVATDIGKFAFSYCNALTSVTLPAATSIGENAFQYCNALASVSLPAATSIGKNAFQFCDALTSVTLPAATSIGDHAFCDCKSLTNVALPAATFIDYYAFESCDALTSVTMPAAWSIGEGAFSSCGLTSVSLPAATSIGNGAFAGCGSLTSVTLPAATSIGYAFCDCQSLSDIYVGSDPAYCNSSPFDNVTYATATLHVPAGCASKYKAARGWEQFAFISEDYDPTGIKNINAEKVKVLCENGNVNITGLKNGEKVEFYSVSGKLLGTSVANAGAVSINTTEHIVICKMAGTSIKVLVK